MCWPVPWVYVYDIIESSEESKPRVHTKFIIHQPHTLIKVEMMLSWLSSPNSSLGHHPFSGIARDASGPITAMLIAYRFVLTGIPRGDSVEIQAHSGKFTSWWQLWLLQGNGKDPQCQVSELAPTCTVAGWRNWAQMTGFMGPPPVDVGFNLNPMGQDAKLTVTRSEQGGS